MSNEDIEEFNEFLSPKHFNIVLDKLIAESPIPLAKFYIGEDVYQQASEILPQYGKKAVIVGGKTAMSVGADRLTKALEKNGVIVTGQVWFGGDATYENVDRCATEKAVQDADMILAMGGGKCCDTCKVLSEKINKPLMTFPTIASNCAPCTALAIMYNADGSMKGNYYSKRPPLHVFINTDIIAHAPIKFLQAGIGDALSKEHEVLLALRNVKLHDTLPLGVKLCAFCSEPLLNYGVEAMRGCEKGQATDALKEVVMSICITTGLVSCMTVCKEYYYNTNIAHCFYYGATVLPSYHDYLHGYWVAYGVLVLLYYDNQISELHRVIDFYKQIGLPTKMSDCGLSIDQLDKLVEKATKVPGWHVDGYELTAERFRESILAVSSIE
ncbi:MAG: iron-containing alcohol dehydrogenase family protein [Alphaproteobacteria bacterium]|nr:iron-containing alcohol dehydrogenase family protein [Alphaproteobacteria bacterium]